MLAAAMMMVAATWVTPANLPNTLAAKGNKLVYNGSTVTLRGVCVGDIFLARKNRPNQDYVTLAKDWNANCVRIGVAPTTYKNANRKSVMEILRSETNAALAAGMFVIIDWHSIGWPDGYYQPVTWAGAAKDLYDSDFKLATDFWTDCAAMFSTDGRVAFQLWCEPVLNDKDWMTPMGSSWKTQKPFMDSLIKTIRNQGAKNLVLATGNRWAYDMNGIKQDLLKDINVGYQWHVYAGHEGNDATKWETALDGLDKIAPVLVTEWGFQRDTTSHFKGTADDFGNKFLKFMEDRGMSWTAWCWHPTWGPPMLEPDWKTPNEYGLFVKRALQKNEKRVAFQKN